MREWNAVISVNERGFRKAIDVLGDFGQVGRTDFFNILLLHTDNMPALLETLRERQQHSPGSLAFLARFIPVERTFTFHSREEFEARAKEAVLEWPSRLAGRSFHVRIRRRGFRGKIVSPEEERLLDEFLLGKLADAGSQARIDFDRPDVVIDIETIGTWAGISFLTRECREKYSFVRE